MVFQQCRLGHSWISGHPHSLLYKPATAANQASSKSVTGSCGNGNSANTGAGQPCGGFNYNHNNNGNSSSSSFLDFVGNSRYQAYTLARFSTLSAASSSASSSSSSSSSSSISGQASSSESQVSGSSSIRQEPTDNASGHHHEERAHSNPADAQSPETSPTSTTPATSSSTTASSLPTSLSLSSATKKEHDDTEDAWAVNESYSGHASSSNPPSSDDSKDDPSRVSFCQDMASSKPGDPAAIDASWRRTSDSIPLAPFSGSSVLSPSPSSSSSSSKAGGLDLSSSTLVQQMLFKERAPHADRSEDDNGRSNKQDQQQHSQEAIESSETRNQSSPTTNSTSASPSLASMLLNQSSGDASELRKANKVAQQQQQQQSKAAPVQDDEDHISKLDIRVGIVRSVTAHPDAESLYIEQVDVGDKDNDEAKEPRTIVSGLVRHVPKEYLEGRAVIVVGNMKPSKLRGVMSQGMLLCAMEQDEKGEVTKVGLLEPAEGSQAGDKVTIEGFTDLETVPAAVLTPKKKWFEKSRIHFSVLDGVAYYKGSPFRTVQGLVRCKSISKGEIS
ncbi:hypothetical protein BGZ47_003858 [Haplosporangium gracile]|nr:hypothetical protein BGZ47_003858 [Haplosporangium gracile]